MNEMPQVAKVKKLVANGEYGSLEMAISLLSTLELDENIWLSLFTKNILNIQLKSKCRETLDLLAQAAATRPDFRSLLLFALPQKLPPR
jgi:plasmid maintenance system antidote protein VapI